MAENFRTPYDGDEIYYKTLTAAFREGETGKYRESRRADRDACRDIERAVSEKTKEGKLIPGEWENALIDEYGEERLRYLLAATVRSSKAGDFSKAQRDWAKTVRISDDAYVNANNRLARDADHDLSGFLDFVMALSSENVKASEGEIEPSDDASPDKEAAGAAQGAAGSAEGGKENDGNFAKDPSVDKEAARATEKPAENRKESDGNFANGLSVDKDVERAAQSTASVKDGKESDAHSAMDLSVDKEAARATQVAKPAKDVEGSDFYSTQDPFVAKETTRTAREPAEDKKEKDVYSTKDPSVDIEASRAARERAEDKRENVAYSTKDPSVDKEAVKVSREPAKDGNVDETYSVKDISADYKKKSEAKPAVYLFADKGIERAAKGAKPARDVSADEKTEGKFGAKDPSGDKDIGEAADLSADKETTRTAKPAKEGKDGEAYSTRGPSVDKKLERVAQATPEPREGQGDGEEEEDGKVEISMPWGAVLRVYDGRTAYVKMPKGRFEGYAFSVPLKYVVREGDEMTLSLPKSFKANLKDREKRETVSAEALAASLSTATTRDYDIVYEPGHDGNDVVTFQIPSSYLLEERDNYCRFALPSSGESVFIKSGFCREDGAIRSLAVPGGALIRVYDPEGGASERRLTARELASLYASAKEEDESLPGLKPVTVRMSRKALAREYTRNVVIRMPRGDLLGYGFYVRRDSVTIEGDILSLALPEGQTLHLKNREDEKRDIAAGELSRYVSLDAKDYEEASSVTRISAPAAALVQKREKSYLFVLPKDKTATFFLGASLVAETSEGFELAIPSSFKIEIKGTSEIMSPEELKGVIEGADPSEFVRPDLPSSAWRYVEIPQEALVFRNERRMYFRMPDGPLDRGAYYYPMALVTEEGGRYRLSVPVDQTVSLFGYGEGPVELNADTFLRAVSGKGAEWYKAEFCEPELSGYGVFTASREKRLRENIPEEMKTLPNWVVVRTPWNRDKGKREKYLISPVTGKFAQSNDPSTWCDFETALAYGKSNGADTLAFALSGDGIACLDVDKCLDSDGNLSPVAQNALKFVPEGSYRELSVSGNGLHVFGRIKEDLDVTSFSKDRKLEFYRKDHFIAVTGDCEEGSKTLGDFSSADMQTFLKSNFEKRKVYRNAGKGVAGLSHMSDRDVVERACSARGGDVFLDLYKGKDVKGNRSNSDMAFMNRLAFWCNGDADQMLRIFYSSGLYRPEKSREYYEYTATKALEGVADRYDPSRYTSSSPRQRPQEAKGGEDIRRDEGKGDG